MLRKAVNYDAAGSDPIGSKTYEELMEIKSFRYLTITAANSVNPWLLSENEYDTPELYFLILGYNGLIHPTELVAGIDIKIPSRTDVMQVLTRGKKPTGTRIASI